MPNFDDFNASLEEAKEKINGILVLIGLVGLGMAAWNIIKLLE